MHRLGEEALEAALDRRRRAMRQPPGEPGERQQQDRHPDRLVQLEQREAALVVGIEKPSASWKPSASAISQWSRIATVL